METLLSNRVDPVDLCLLQNLCDGRDPVAKHVLEDMEKTCGVKLNREEVDARLTRMEESGVILRRKTALLDPTKLYDHVFLILLKLHLPSVVPGKGTLSWDEAVDEIWTISQEKGRPIRILFTILGWGDYDIAALAYVNDLAGYYEFQKELAERGIIEKYDTKTLHHFGIPYKFEPIMVPGHREASAYIRDLREIIAGAVDVASDTHK